MRKLLKFIFMTSCLICTFVATSICCSAEEYPKDLHGTDVAHYSSLIDWQTLKTTQYSDFVFIKVSEGEHTLDCKYQTNASGAKSVGMPYSFYHYFHCYGEESAKLQAQRFYNMIKDYDYSLIPAVDIEETDGKDAPEIQKDLRVFVDEFESLSGRKPLIYTYYSFANQFLEDAFSDCPLWIARYNSEVGTLKGWDDYYAWQFSGDTVKLDGIDNPADLDIADERIFLDNKNTTTSKECVSNINVNSIAGKEFQVVDENGNTGNNHYVFKGDNIEILNVNYTSQIAEIYYPVGSNFVHAYIKNEQSSLHNSGYKKWKNGSTNETVYNDTGNVIGTIYPYETATILKEENEIVQVLYDTNKGSETKSGYVKFGGI